MSTIHTCIPGFSKTKEREAKNRILSHLKTTKEQQQKSHYIFSRDVQLAAYMQQFRNGWVLFVCFFSHRTLFFQMLNAGFPASYSKTSLVQPSLYFRCCFHPSKGLCMSHCNGCFGNTEMV